MTFLLLWHAPHGCALRPCSTDRRGFGMLSGSLVCDSHRASLDEGVEARGEARLYRRRGVELNRRLVVQRTGNTLGERRTMPLGKQVQCSIATGGDPTGGQY